MALNYNKAWLVSPQVTEINFSSGSHVDVMVQLDNAPEAVEWWVLFVSQYSNYIEILMNHIN